MGLRTRVLVSAYACEPGRGSEAEVGWQWVLQVSKHFDTTVLVRENNKELIEAVSSSYAGRSIRFEYVDLPRFLRWWKRGNRGVRLYYRLWQLLALKRAYDLHQQDPFDIIHHVTFVSDWVGPAVSAIRAPFIWGPIGSNPRIPYVFFPTVGLREMATNRFRQLLRGISLHAAPFVVIARSRARRILAANEECLGRLPITERQKAIVVSQNSVERSLVAKVPRELSGSFRVLTAGRLIPIKGQILAVEAFAGLASLEPKAVLTIAGEGPMRERLARRAADLGVRGSVRFVGQLPREELFAEMAQSDVFLFPSFEGGGMVVIEAMAHGLPVVCLRYGGPGEYVDELCGRRIPVTEPGRVVRDLAQALVEIVSDPVSYRQMSKACIERVSSHYESERLGERIRQIYEDALPSDRRTSDH